MAQDELGQDNPGTARISLAQYESAQTRLAELQRTLTYAQYEASEEARELEHLVVMYQLNPVVWL